MMKSNSEIVKAIIHYSLFLDELALCLSITKKLLYTPLSVLTFHLGQAKHFKPKEIYHVLRGLYLKETAFSFIIFKIVQVKLGPKQNQGAYLMTQSYQNFARHT